MIRGACVLAALLCAGCAAPRVELGLLQERFLLGASLEETRSAARAHCGSVRETEYSAELAAPYAAQTQIDCIDYVFGGAPRKIELLVNDGALGFLWLMIEPRELDAARAALRNQYGAPDCVNADYTGYAAHGVAVRNEPAEYLVATPSDFAAITGGCS